MNILIIYQHRVREYDNALLLKAALEYKGHHVDIKNDAAELSLLKRYDFYILPCVYDDENLMNLSYRFNIFDRPIINLRYEQLNSKRERALGSTVPKGKAGKIPLTNWGIEDYEHCKKYGMDEENLYISGQISLDFLRSEFEEFWYSKFELFHKFNIKTNHKLFLFISSLGLPDNEINQKQLINAGIDIGEVEKLIYVENGVRKAVLCWFSKIIEEENIIIIYRPHPCERIYRSPIEELAKRYPNNFYIIGELNVQQWIKCSDVILHWISTSIVDCFLARKKCIVLRPEQYPMIDEWDTLIYDGVKSSMCYDDFKNSIKKFVNNSQNIDFPIAEKKICEYYCIDDIPSFVKIVRLFDSCSKHRNNFCNCAKYEFTFRRIVYLIKNNIIIKVLFKNLYFYISERLNISLHNKYLESKFSIEDWNKEISYRKKFKIYERRKLDVLKRIVRKFDY